MLKDSGFIVSERCYSRASCFDFAARKDDNLFFLKIQSDIENFSTKDAYELKIISECVQAGLLLLVDKTRERPLEDDTVYSRHNVSAITPRTFENVVIRRVLPLIQAGPGGYYVEIDGEDIKKRRQELGFSVGELAERAGISRRTLYGYERGMAKASVSTAYNLIFILGVPVAKSVNIFDKPKTQYKCILATVKRVFNRSLLLQKILRKLGHCTVTEVRKAPFDFVINLLDEQTRIIGGVTGKKERELDRRIDEILSLSRVAQAHPVLITDGQKPSNKNIPCFLSHEFSKIKSPEDLIT